MYKIILSFSYDLHNSQVEENKAVIYAVLPSKLKKVIFTTLYIDFIFRTLSKTSGEFNPTLWGMSIFAHIVDGKIEP